MFKSRIWERSIDARVVRWIRAVELMALSRALHVSFGVAGEVGSGKDEPQRPFYSVQVHRGFDEVDLV